MRFGSRIQHWDGTKYALITDVQNMINENNENLLTSAVTSSAVEEISFVEQAISQPKKGTVDGQSFENYSISELIEAEKYLESKKAANSGKLGIRFVKCRRGGVHE